jgi:hypothetical protein
MYSFPSPPIRRVLARRTLRWFVPSSAFIAPAYSEEATTPGLSGLGGVSRFAGAQKSTLAEDRQRPRDGQCEESDPRGIFHREGAKSRRKKAQRGLRETPT